jgi:hypothetical protein
MPVNTRVKRCVKKVSKKKKHSKGSAIAICQASTKQSYRTGRTLDNGRRQLLKIRKLLAEIRKQL